MTSIANKETAKEFIMSGWHLKKEVTIGQLITLIVLLISGLWWAASVETRITHLISEDIRIEQKNDMQNKNIERILNRIERKQDKIFDKLDGKADK